MGIGEMCEGTPRAVHVGPWCRGGWEIRLRILDCGLRIDQANPQSAIRNLDTTLQAAQAARRLRHQPAPTVVRPNSDRAIDEGSGLSLAVMLIPLTSTWALMLPALVAVGGPGIAYGPIVAVYVLPPRNNCCVIWPVNLFITAALLAENEPPSLPLKVSEPVWPEASSVICSESV